MDPVSIMSGVSAAIEIARTLNTASQAMSDAERKLQIADLVSKLAEAKIELASLQDEFQRKDQEISSLKVAFTKRDALVESQGFLYEANSSGEPHGYPYCSRCMEVDALFIRATERAEGRQVRCPNCKSTYRAAVHSHS